MRSLLRSVKVMQNQALGLAHRQQDVAPGPPCSTLESVRNATSISRVHKVLLNFSVARLFLQLLLEHPGAKTGADLVDFCAETEFVPDSQVLSYTED